MSYILLSENCKGRHIKFIERDGRLLSKPVGKEYSGVLALQTFEDRDYMRMTFADGKNVWLGAAKKIFGMGSSNPFKAYKSANEDFLCHFDFSEKELRTGQKKIEFQRQFCGLVVYSALVFYDFSTKQGCSYLFFNDEDAEKFARRIGVKEVQYLDYEGEVTGVEPLDDENAESGSKGAEQRAYSVDADSCICCGSCAAACPVDAIRMGDSSYIIDTSLCVECGACSASCPTEAIRHG